jgi:hypothetical protein
MLEGAKVGFYAEVAVVLAVLAIGEVFFFTLSK